MSHTESYHFFWSGPFSQWHPSQIALEGGTFGFAEQAMMFLKALLFKDTTAAQRILATEDPGKQKAIGRQVRGFKQAVWDAQKFDIVLRVSRAKFDQNKGLRRKLFQTGSTLLVEASPHDTVWGIGLDAATAAQTDPKYWPGENLLGKALTQVRGELAVAYPEEAQSCAPNMDGAAAQNQPLPDKSPTLVRQQSDTRNTPSEGCTT